MACNTGSKISRREDWASSASTAACSSSVARAAVRCRSKSGLLSLRVANRGGFEFRRARLGIYCVNGEIVSRNLIVEMNSEKREAGAQSGIEANRSDDRAASRADAHAIPF